MKLNQNQLQRIVHHLLKEIKKSSVIEAKVDEDQLKSVIKAVIQQNMADEAKLDQEVETMMDQLERQNPGSFQRYKMFPLLKKKLAEQKGFVL